MPFPVTFSHHTLYIFDPTLLVGFPFSFTRVHKVWSTLVQSLCVLVAIQLSGVTPLLLLYSLWSKKARTLITSLQTTLQVQYSIFITVSQIRLTDPSTL
jgi:hypothetical protein